MDAQAKRRSVFAGQQAPDAHLAVDVGPLGTGSVPGEDLLASLKPRVRRSTKRRPHPLVVHPLRIPRERLCRGIVTYREKYFVFVARDGIGSAVGFVTLYESYALYAEGAFGTIPELYVRPAYRSTYFPQLTLTERLQAQCGSGFAAE